MLRARVGGVKEWGGYVVGVSGVVTMGVGETEWVSCGGFTGWCSSLWRLWTPMELKKQLIVGSEVHLGWEQV